MQARTRAGRSRDRRCTTCTIRRLIISRDESSETSTVLHYDSRGVPRMDQMSFGEGLWKMLSEAPGFLAALLGHA